MRSSRSVLLFLALSTTARLGAQILPFEAYTIRQGLPSNHVTKIYQDTDGYLWIGTDNGLSRYDGREFKTFAAPGSSANFFVTDILQGRNSRSTFWVGTIGSGLVRIDHGAMTVISVGDNATYNLFEDRNGVLWCSSGTGVYRVDKDSVSCADAKHQVSLVEGEGDSAVLIISAQTIARHRLDGSLVWRRQLQLRPHEFIATTLRDSANTLWAYSSAGALLEFSGPTVRYHRFPLGLGASADIPSEILDGGAGSMWITTPGGMVIVDKKRSTVRVIRDFGKPGIKLSGAIFRDREGTIWIGTYADGLLKLAEQRVHRIPIDSISDQWYNFVACSDSSGHIWISTRGTLYEVVRSLGDWKLFRHSTAADGTTLADCAVLIDSENRLWAGNPLQKSFVCCRIDPRPGGASRLSRVVMLPPRVFPDRTLSTAYSISGSHRGWFSTYPAGVALVDLDHRRLVRAYNEDDGLPPDLCRALLMDSAGRLWYGSWNAGISVYEIRADSLRALKSYAGVQGKGVRSLYADRDGVTWIGTRFGGLVRYRRGEYREISTDNGLLSNAVWSIAETEHRVWCGTDVGLETVDKQTGDPLAPTAELIGNRVYACGAYGEDFVWCVTGRELVVYEDPERQMYSRPPPVFISSCTVNGVAVPVDSMRELSYTQNTWVIEFVGLSFKDEQKVCYQYRMLGIDSAWTRPVRDHSVTYASLRPGHYTFEVRALNADGVLSDHPATLAFTIVPPVWQRVWFMAAAGIVAGLIAYALFRYRLYHLMRLERLRLRIASDLHDDVGTSVSGIILATQVLEREVAQGLPSRSGLSELLARAEMTQEALRDIVWLLNPRNDTLDEFVLKLKDTARRQLTDVPCTFTVTGEQSFHRMGLDFKRHVVLFFKESVTNVAKHASASRVDVELTMGERLFSLIIHDDGKGFDPRIETMGNGLRNLRMRADLIGGSCDITSASGRGTTVSLTAGITYSRTFQRTGNSFS